MKLTGKRLERQGSWGGPRIIALWFEWVRPKREKGLRKSVDYLFNQCEELDISCTICHIEYDDMPYSIKYPQVKFNKYKKRWNRVIPFYIETLLREYNSPLLYMHVDTIIKKLPSVEIFDKSVLVSIGKSNQSEKYDGRRTHILGSPVYFNSDNISKRFVKKWMRYCNDSINQNFGEHNLLKKTYKELKYLDEVSCFNCIMSSRDKNEDSYLYF